MKLCVFLCADLTVHDHATVHVARYLGPTTQDSVNVQTKKQNKKEQWSFQPLCSFFVLPIDGQCSLSTFMWPFQGLGLGGTQQIWWSCNVKGFLVSASLWWLSEVWFFYFNMLVFWLFYLFLLNVLFIFFSLYGCLLGPVDTSPFLYLA